MKGEVRWLKKILLLGLCLLLTACTKTKDTPDSFSTGDPVVSSSEQQLVADYQQIQSVMGKLEAYGFTLVQGDLSQAITYKTDLYFYGFGLGEEDLSHYLEVQRIDISENEESSGYIYLFQSDLFLKFNFLHGGELTYACFGTIEGTAGIEESQKCPDMETEVSSFLAFKSEVMDELLTQLGITWEDLMLPYNYLDSYHMSQAEFVAKHK